ADRLLHVQERVNVQQGVDLQVVQVIADLDDPSDFRRQHVIAAGPAGAVPPLGQANDGVGPASRGELQVQKRCGKLGPKVLGVIGDEQPDQKVAQGGGFFAVAEGCLHHLPEGFVQVEFLDLFPNGRRVLKVEFALVGEGVKDRADQVE